MHANETTAPARHALLETLAKDFPVFREMRPLALGIHKAILERCPELDPAQLRTAMKVHTASTRYLKALLTTRERFDLDGKPQGEVTDEQRDVANTQLRERFKKAADRRKAEELRKRELLREQEGQQRRQQKLNELAARFNRR